MGAGNDVALAGGAMPEIKVDPEAIARELAKNKGTPIQQELEQRAAAATAKPTLDVLDQYAQSGDIGAAMQAMQGMKGADRSNMREQLASDPYTASLLASQQVMSDPLQAGLWGKEGLQGRLASEEQDLSKRGWSMKPEDQEAYGQASDEIARMSGAQERMLANAMANRGLSASPGAMSRGFAGLTGNKFEQLANAQRQIAQNRMQTNMQRLQSTRNMMQSMSQQGAQQQQQQWGRNMAGVENQQKLRDALAGRQFQQGQFDWQKQMDQANMDYRNRALEEQRRQYDLQRQDANDSDFFGTLMGGALGAGVGALTGGLGTAAGAGIGKSIFGTSGKAGV